MILPCKCKHAGQDELHGEGRRVFTEKTATVKDEKGKSHKKIVPKRCTVCGAEHK